jgi:hypothetical protein
MSEPDTKPWIPSHPLFGSHNNERLTEQPTGCKRVGSTFRAVDNFILGG